MKIIIIGGVAAGTSAAAKARRNSESAEIKIFEKDSDISYSGCGLPYYIGKFVNKREEIVPRNADFFKKKYNVDVYTEHEVLEIDHTKRAIKVNNIKTNEVFWENYDKLVIATGASSFIPAIDGVYKTNVFTLRNVKDADRIKDYINKYNPRKAVIVGAGFIGLELTENFINIGIDVAIVEMAKQPMPSLDPDMAVYLRDYLEKKKVKLILNDSIEKIEGNDDKACCVVLKSGKRIESDLVILSVGVRPNVELAKRAGIEIGETGAIKVNESMQTSIKDIYACGDCAESFSIITKKPFFRPLGSTANKMGRIAGEQITGGELLFRGILGTGIFRVFDLTVAQTGLSEREAIEEGYEVEVCHNIKPDKPEYMNGEEMIIKAVADRHTGRILGAQIIGKSGVDKRIDVFVTAITFGAKAEDLFHLDLAYAPPFSTTKDPVMYTGMILENSLKKGRKLIMPKDLKKIKEQSENAVILDVREESQYKKSHIEGSRNLPLEKIRETIHEIDKEKTVITYCNKGVTGNAAQNIFLNNGFNEVYNISGGHKNYSIQKTYENDG